MSDLDLDLTSQGHALHDRLDHAAGSSDALDIVRAHRADAGVVRERPRGPMIDEMAHEHRPRERLLRRGGASLTDAELLAVLLRTGRAGQSALDMGQEILDQAGGLQGLLHAELESLRRKGLGEAKAATILAAVELGRRLSHAKMSDIPVLDHPAAVSEFLWLRYARCDQEVMGALYLDNRNRLTFARELFRGAFDRITVQPRTILREALLHRAVAFLLFHTHPSGDPTPSAEDVLFTQRMRKAAETLGIRMVDHMVIAHGGAWVSLRRRGQL